MSSAPAVALWDPSRCLRELHLQAVSAINERDELRIVLFFAPDLPELPLREELVSLLPPVYMPALLFGLPELPLLPNGKVDKKQLHGRAHSLLQVRAVTPSGLSSTVERL